MSQELDDYLNEVGEFYDRTVFNNDRRIINADKLHRHLQSAIEVCRKNGVASISRLIEVVNEAAVANIILNDPTLLGTSIFYEPKISDHGTLIDFVVKLSNCKNIYIEVKTIRPQVCDNDDNWCKYINRKKYHTKNVDYVVYKDWLGAKLYGESFSSRRKFLEYTIEFEERLSQACEVTAGDGILVFCGTGMEWHKDELEDFVDFYVNKNHWNGDPFAEMERHSINTQHTSLRHNIKSFGYVKRPVLSVAPEKWLCSVRGPSKQ